MEPESRFNDNPIRLLKTDMRSAYIRSAIILFFLCLCNCGQRLAAATEKAGTAGIGVALKLEQGRMLVGRILPDTNAAQTNAIKPGDQITAIAEGNAEPVNVAGLDLAKVVSLIRGEKGTVLRLTVIPAGGKEGDARVISLTRGEVKGLNVFGDGKLLSSGTKAPDFKFAGLLDGRNGSLSDQLGKVVVLDVWASWCKPCIEHVGELETLKKEHPEWKERVVILAVSIDEKREDAASRCRAKHWTNITPVWTEQSVCKAYHVSGLPTIYIIDRKGTVIAADHRLDVPELLQNLLAGDSK
jgi:thiol-disulfide isomerase/thioredoxin